MPPQLSQGTSNGSQVNPCRCSRDSCYFDSFDPNISPAITLLQDLIHRTLLNLHNILQECPRS